MENIGKPKGRAMVAGTFQPPQQDEWPGDDAAQDDQRRGVRPLASPAVIFI